MKQESLVINNKNKKKRVKTEHKCSKTRKNNTNRGLVKGGQMGSTNPLKSTKQHGSDQPTEPRVGCVRANGQRCGSYD